jgi:outer membrane lipoprotein-sorting protein
MRRSFLISKRVAVALSLFVAMTLCAHSPVASAQGRGAVTLESVLGQMDSQAKNFHSLSADVERTKVTVVVNDRSTETGTMLAHDDKMLLDMKAPDPRTILLSGGTLSVYTPGLKRVEEYDLGKNRGMVDQFLLLGFGTSGKDIRNDYAATLVGEPTIDDKKTAELELIPKSQAALAYFTKIQIWLDEISWLPVQQQIFETGSGDYSIIRYSKVVRNPQIPDSQFKAHWPKGTQKVKPQG